MEDYWNIFGHEITDSDYAQELCLENSADELPQAAFLYFPQLLEKSTASYYHRKCPFLTNKPYLPLDRDRNYPRPIPRDSVAKFPSKKMPRKRERWRVQVRVNQRKECLFQRPRSIGLPHIN
jgi:hypothetical protein